MYISPQERDRIKARFDKFTKRDNVTGCLLWTGGTSTGYGRMWVGSQKNGTLRKEFSHRVAWVLSGREISDTKPFILHSCDNRLCCAVEHLWEGDYDDNNKDRSKKNRSRRSARGLPRGVQPNSNSNSYQARLQVGSKQIYLGSFATPEKARNAARQAEIKYFGAVKD